MRYRIILVMCGLLVLVATPARSETQVRSTYDQDLAVPLEVDAIIQDAILRVLRSDESTDGWPPYKCYGACGGGAVLSFAQCRAGGGGVSECGQQAGAAAAGCAILCAFTRATGQIVPVADASLCPLGKARG